MTTLNENFENCLMKKKTSLICGHFESRFSLPWRSPQHQWTCQTAACEQALRGALAAGLEKKESLRLWNLKSTSNSPAAPHRWSCQISADQCEEETNANVNKHWKTCAKGNDVITNVISANLHFASSILMQIFKFQRRSCTLLPFPTLPPQHPGELACRLVKLQGILHVHCIGTHVWTWCVAHWKSPF